MPDNNYKFFTNKDCQYYPCHNFRAINCLFCFCPLYPYECLGNYTYTKDHIKDCSNCQIPHKEGGYEYVVKFLKGIKHESSKD
jgi:Zn-finger protein